MNRNFSKYPLTFIPILKEKIWGGTKLKTFLNKSITSDAIGESWEISALQNNLSIIDKGLYSGKSLKDLIDLYPQEILGKAIYRKFGKHFPLLFKYIDATKDLSIQVHPNDELAIKRHNSFGKTEMWYILQADPDSKLIIGFNKNSNENEYIQNVSENALLSILHTEKVSKGDAFFLKTGTIHAIGSGILLAEIQQASDITYRIYDWDRKDKHGNKRELSVDLALKAIDYKKINAKKEYGNIENKSEEIVNCPFFTTNRLSLNGTFFVQNDKDRFMVYMCVEGSFSILHNSILYNYSIGDTILLPASLNEHTLNGFATILQVYV